MAGQDDELSRLRVTVEDDHKIIGAAKWMPRIELECRGKRALMLGGHQVQTNTIMVWCTCGLSDQQHGKGRNFALDAWVVEHCRGESLDDYDEDEEDEEGEEGEDRVDSLVMKEAQVVRVGRNTLPRPVSLRQLVASELVAQGGNRELKGARFWLYWYDQDIPRSGGQEFAGLGSKWAPGGYVEATRGVWYRARVVKCDTATGQVQIKYDVDQSDDRMYLLLAFTHFGASAPTAGSRGAAVALQFLPDMSRVPLLGTSPSSPGKRTGKGSAVPSLEATPAAPGGTAQPAAGAAQLQPAPPPAQQQERQQQQQQQQQKPGAKTAMAATAYKGQGAAGDAHKETKPAKKVKAATKESQQAKPVAAAAAAAGGGDSAGGAKGKEGGAAVKAAKGPVAEARRAAEEGKAVAGKPGKATDASGPGAGASARGAGEAAAGAGARAGAGEAKSSKLEGHKAQKKELHVDVGVDNEEDSEELLLPPGKRRKTEAEAPVVKAAPAATAPPRAAPPPAPAATSPHETRTASATTSGGGAAAAATAATATAATARQPTYLGASVAAAAAASGPGGAAAAQLIAKARRRPGFKAVISGNHEKVPVLLFNEVDNASLPPFAYQPDYALPGEWEALTARAPELAAAARYVQRKASRAEPPWGQPCGRQYHVEVHRRQLAEDAQLQADIEEWREGRRERPPVRQHLTPADSPENYNSTGQLLKTRPLGIHECSKSCTEEACKFNMQLTHGPTKPLEVFRTPDSDWGVRCAEPMRAGDFVAAVVGRLVLARDVLPRAPPGAAARTAGQSRTVLTAPKGVVLLNSFATIWMVGSVRSWAGRHGKNRPKLAAAAQPHGGSNPRHQRSSSRSKRRSSSSSLLPACVILAATRAAHRGRGPARLCVSAGPAAERQRGAIRTAAPPHVRRYGSGPSVSHTGRTGGRGPLAHAVLPGAIRGHGPAGGPGTDVRLQRRADHKRRVSVKGTTLARSCAVGVKGTSLDTLAHARAVGVTGISLAPRAHDRAVGVDKDRPGSRPGDFPGTGAVVHVVRASAAACRAC